MFELEVFKLFCLVYMFAIVDTIVKCNELPIEFQSVSFVYYAIFLLPLIHNLFHSKSEQLEFFPLFYRYHEISKNI